MASSITMRPVGKNGPLVPGVGFGAMGLSGGYGLTDSDDIRLKLLDRAWELGCTHWDTADIYGDNEDLIGKWFALHPERRADIFLATKFGLVADPAGDMGVSVKATPEHAVTSIDSSLKRLNVDYVDLWYLHRPNTAIPIEKVMAPMKRAVEEGKAKLLGLSEVSSATLRRAHAIHPIAAVQLEYNPWSLDIEGESGTHMLATCRELGVSVVAYSPLGRGIMTGKYRSAAEFGEGDVRGFYERFQGENFVKNLVVVDKFTEFAKKKGCSPGQMVLAWLLAQGEDIMVIPGTKKEKYLEENFGSGSVSISKEEERELREIVDEAGVAGSRSSKFGCYSDTAPLEE